MHFRHLQTQQDLLSSAIYLAEHSLPDDPIIKTVTEHLKTTAETRAFDFSALNSEEINAFLTVAACSPEESLELFWFATAVLLAMRLNNPKSSTDFEWEWDTFADQYRLAPMPIRAAIMNGFEMGKTNESVSLTIETSQAERLSCETDSVVATLVSLSKLMDVAEQKAVALLGHCSEQAKHLKALQTILRSPDCAFPSDENWYPQEVIELASWIPENPGFVSSTSLLLLNAIYDIFEPGFAAERWNSKTRLAFQSLPEAPRTTIFAAFRHIFEMYPEYLPDCEEFCAQTPNFDDFLPWMPPPP